MVVHRSRGQATTLGRIAPSMGKVGIDVEVVMHGSQFMEVVVNEVPDWIWVCLDLVSDDARPGGRIDDEQVCATGFNPRRGLVKGCS